MKKQLPGRKGENIKRRRNSARINQGFPPRFIFTGCCQPWEGEEEDEIFYKETDSKCKA